MISQFYQKSKGKVMMAVVAFLCLTSYSCKETQDSIVSGDTVVKVNLLGVATPASSNAPKTKAGGATNQDVQVSSVPFSKSASFNVTLTADATKEGNGLRASANRAAVGVKDVTPLDENIKYTILVYDADGAYVTEQAYTNGVDNNAGITLDAGKTYTFIAYSINTNSIPAVENKQSLSAASLENISSDLMYFSKSVTLTAGENNLDVILKHQYSQIITQIKMHTNTTGNITEVIGAVIKPTHAHASLKLKDGSITYNGENENGAEVLFPALGSDAREIVSFPTLLINPTSGAGKLNIAKLTIAGETKENLLIEDLNIVPGQRYTLTLNYEVCTQDVVAEGMNWTYPIYGNPGDGAVVNNIEVNGEFKTGNFNAVNGSIIAQNITAPGADYGFVFDIYSLDNSFNMEVNGTKISAQELQFEIFKEGKGTAQTIGFTDGTSHGDGNIPQVWANGMSGNYGTKTNPLIKVLIAADGNVTVFGRKSATGELEAMRMINGTPFNKVTWNGGNATNAVKITQRVENATGMQSYGIGKKKGSCNNN